MTDAERLLVLADDFTGACDAAAAFASSRATLVLHGLPTEWPAEAEVLGVDLDVRERSAADGQSLTSAAARALTASRLFLKIDSTLRGPIAGLAAGALEGSGRDIAVLAPAFPEQGRFLRAGRLVADGKPGASLIEALGMERTALLGSNFARSPEDVEEAVEHARRRGARHVVVDTDGIDCLRSVALAWQRHVEWLLVGSAGLARQVAHPSSAKVTPVPGLVLLAAGSPAAATQAQIEQLRGRGPVLLIEDDTLIYPRPTGDHQLLVICTPPALERDSGERARAVADVLAAWAPEFRPAAVVLAGGATARLACERVGARGIRLCGELSPGVPFGCLVDGLWDGVRVVTKAGGFGTPNTLLDVVQALGVSSVAERTNE